MRFTSSHEYRTARLVRVALRSAVALAAVLLLGEAEAGTNPADLESAPEARPMSDSIVTPLWPYGKIPLAPMGSPRTKSILDDMKGDDLAKADPERESVYRGYRIVKPLPESVRLYGAEESAWDLAGAILAAIGLNDAALLQQLMMTKDEFTSILWREFPVSRPVTNITPDDSWFFHIGHTRDAVNEILDEWGGRRLKLESIECTIGLAPYQNFHLLRGVVIHATDEESGEQVTIDQAKTFLERNGLWKVYIFHN